MKETAAPFFDGYAALACALAVGIMVLPTEADILFVLFANRQIALAGAFAVICFVSVLVPTIISWRRHRAAPQKWCGIGYLYGTVSILILNGLMVAAVFCHVLSR